MHTLAVQLAPVLAAEKSHVPFYIAGGLLIVWALIVSLVLGRNGDFPSNLQGERAVIAVTALLVIAAAGTAVITAGGSAGATESKTTTSAVTPQVPAPAAPATASTPTPAPAAAATSLKLAADPNNALAYTTKTLSAKAGKITITMANVSQLEHNVTIASGSTVIGATPTFVGGAKSVTVTLKPGKYTFYCSVPGHRQGGMEGTLTVS